MIIRTKPVSTDPAAHESSVSPTATHAQGASLEEVAEAHVWHSRHGVDLDDGELLDGGTVEQHRVRRGHE